MKQMAGMEEANRECMIALQDELQQVMEELEFTQQDRDKKVALGMNMEVQLQSLQAELGFVNKQLTVLQQQHQGAIEQAGYYRAERDTLKLEQDTLRSQLPSPGLLTPAASAFTSSVQEPVQPTTTIQ